jgi:hypothetical protein
LLRRFAGKVTIHHFDAYGLAKVSLALEVTIGRRNQITNAIIKALIGRFTN